MVTIISSRLTHSNVTNIINQLDIDECTNIFAQVYEKNNDLTEQIKECQKNSHTNESIDECLANLHFPLEEPRGVRITSCDIPLQGEIRATDELTIDLVLIPYESDKNIKYIFDIGKTLETDRISVFLENGFLKIQIKSENYEEEMLKVPITNVQMNPNNRYGITTRVSNDSISLFIFDYSKIGTERFVAKEVRSAENSINLTGSLLVMGGDLRLENQFDGVFDEMRVTYGIQSDEWIIATHCATSSVGPLQVT
jgi:hypothetical protein